MGRLCFAGRDDNELLRIHRFRDRSISAFILADHIWSRQLLSGQGSADVAARSRRSATYTGCDSLGADAASHFLIASSDPHELHAEGEGPARSPRAGPEHTCTISSDGRFQPHGRHDDAFGHLASALVSGHASTAQMSSRKTRPDLDSRDEDIDLADEHSFHLSAYIADNLCALS